MTNYIFKDMRKSILKASFLGNDGNLQSCFSSLEIIWTLYDRVLDITKENIHMPHDRFVLSKGQSNLALMTVLAYKTFIDIEELYTFCKPGSRIMMQADRTKFNGIVEASAGSLGHGFPIAVGMAWASKINGTNERVYCLAGDGEMNEGTMWESLIFASSERLNNLTLIIDDNKSIGKMINMGNMKNKLEAFGFDVCDVNGHDVDELAQALLQESENPKAILANTKRGYGCETLMNDRSWFHRAPNRDEFEKLCAEVDVF